MTIKFVCETNKPYAKIEDVRFVHPNGSYITLNRKTEILSIEGTSLKMEWFDCYLWAINEYKIFARGNGEGTILTEYGTNEFKKFLRESGSKAEFDLEESSDDDYAVRCIEFTIEE